MDDDAFKKDPMGNTDFGSISYFGKPHKNESKVIWCRVPFHLVKWHYDEFSLSIGEKARAVSIALLAVHSKPVSLLVWWTTFSITATCLNVCSYWKSHKKLNVSNVYSKKFNRVLYFEVINVNHYASDCISETIYQFIYFCVCSVCKWFAPVFRCRRVSVSVWMVPAGCYHSDLPASPASKQEEIPPGRQQPPPFITTRSATRSTSSTSGCTLQCLIIWDMI